MAEAGLHPAAGGDGSALCSGDMLLEALIACAGITLNAVATAMGIELRDAGILAECDLYFRDTLGIDRDVPAEILEIRLRFRLNTEADEETLAQFVKLTERCCVVFQTLNKPPSLSVDHENTVA